MDKLLIQNTRVVSLDPDVEASLGADECDILVVDGRIAEIGRNLGADDAERIDGSGTIAVPGFVDTHRHTWQAVLRGVLTNGTLGDYFREVLMRLGPAFREEDIYAGNLIGSYEALNAGVTTTVDWFNNAATPGHADAAVAALRETGIRSLFGYGTPIGARWVKDSSLKHPHDAERVRSEYFSSSDQLLTFALALRGTIGVDPVVTKHDFDLARSLDARITVHAGVRIPGIPPVPGGEVRVMYEAGLLGPDTTIVHGNEVDNGELDMLAECGATVSVAPYVELVMGQGVPPTNRLVEHGLRPSLSTDVASAVPGDMFTQMRTALAQARGATIPADPREPFAPRLTAEDVLRFATIDGAAACGLADRIGTLSVGKDADIVLIRSDAINTMPGADHPVSTVVTSADTSNVDTVLVRGTVVKRDGTLVGVDLERLRRLGGAAREHVMTAVGEKQ
ncbi:amidohydrolase family protein [Streptomyces spongiae]|uniref:Amidohydrolase family protein n=1 Tax=Streptomyces spongiae TaxID=565072 RepID=A0A5N8XBA2_9ACTN|nr:amidohydrolase family protein [Streptomyces spongiae]MPY56188.1 amidohydrolase family protein [Streptomyces spongiae]